MKTSDDNFEGVKFEGLRTHETALHLKTRVEIGRGHTMSDWG